MNNDDKKKYLQILQQNESYLNVINSIDSKSDKRKVKSFVEDVFLNIISGFTVATKIVHENPEKVVEIESERISKNMSKDEK